MRQKLTVPFVEAFLTPEDIRIAYERLPIHQIKEVSWADYPYLPHVNFRIGHTHHSVILEYVVCEKHLKSDYKTTNDPVYKDSCVEFFVSLDGVHYYNFEFNSIGTALVGYGTADKDSRERLSAELIEKMKVTSHIEDRAIDEEQQWALQVDIPFELFCHDAIGGLKGVQATANFYKCGDDLPEPHFVSWNRIDTTEPNFHMPSYFGEIEFV